MGSVFANVSERQEHANEIREEKSEWRFSSFLWESTRKLRLGKTSAVDANNEGHAPDLHPV